jgi:peptidoglycan hydrolase-like protein with peptidoglycan-binding domain
MPISGSPTRAVARSASGSASLPRTLPRVITGRWSQADYDDQQARLAGIQRLLVIAGYDASPIDGMEGARTQSAIKAFLRDRKLTPDAAARPDFFATLHEAARNPEGHGFSWCNETQYTIMASLGVVEMGAIVTRGWYKVAAGQCVRPALRIEPLKVYS